ncbi:hypothetical protein K435DRAFT_866404 [Dendrothele bispora CBS 962.96]|uniref:Uncharacterized protein n=1 Tax=Dendrothele bispora (strain CBS 962.96) TaxID=1314807 RepID=A0A4S8LH39_DENBC|nr:hypothetical protein K435DRAFT_866404 [Dendrothele bispora CBS 962.96]
MPASRHSTVKPPRQLKSRPYKPHRWVIPDVYFLQAMIQPPRTPAYFIPDDEELKAKFLIRCHINFAIESELVPCQKVPDHNHSVSISPKGVLEIECEHCDVEKRCRFISVWEEIQLHSAFRQWQTFASERRVQEEERESYRNEFWDLVREVEEERKAVEN